MKKKIRIGILLFLLVLGMTVFVGAGETEDGKTTADQKLDPGQVKTVRLGVLVWKFSDTFGTDLREAIEKHAAETGADLGIEIELDVQDADGDLGLQEKQAEQMFREGMDLVIVNLADTTEGQYIDDLSIAWETPVLFYNREPHDVDIIRDIEAFYVGTAPEEAGTHQAQVFDELYRADPALIDRNGDESINYLLFEGEPDNPEAIVRTEYCIRTLMELDYRMEALAETQVADWDEEKAESMMSAILENTDPGDIEAVFCNNDAMAIGVVKALEKKGYNLPDGGDDARHVCVLGVDATEEAMAYISRGQIDGTVHQDADAMGKAVIEIALNRVLTGSYLEGTGYELSDDEYSVRIPYAPVTKGSFSPGETTEETP